MRPVLRPSVALAKVADYGGLILFTTKMNLKYIIKFVVFIIIAFICVKYNCVANEDETDADNGVSKSLIKVNATVDKTKITIGEKVRFEIRIDSSEEIEVLHTDISDRLKDLTVVDSGSYETGSGEIGSKETVSEEGGIVLERWYVLETFTIGTSFISAIEIKHKKKGEDKIRVAKTPELFIEVVSLLDEDASDIRDIIPPVPLKKNYFRLYIIIAIALGVLGIAGGVILFLYRRKHRRRIEFVPEPLPAHEIAYGELENLRAMGLTAKGRIKEYYYRLSNIVRHYIENRFRLMAPERTTEEFLAEMITTHKLEQRHKQLISNFLEHCDLVKYAKYGPNNQEIEGAFDSAKRLVDETREDINDEMNVHEMNVHKEKELDRVTT